MISSDTGLWVCQSWKGLHTCTLSPVLRKDTLLSYGAFNLSGLAKLKELVLAGVNGKQKSTPCECQLCSLACFQCQKYQKLFCTIISVQYSALKTSAHFASSPCRSVITIWPYSKEKASSARTSSVSYQN